MEISWTFSSPPQTFPRPLSTPLPYNVNFTLQFWLYMLTNVAVNTADKNVKLKINNAADDYGLLFFKTICRIAFALTFIKWWCTILCVEYKTEAILESPASIFLALTPSVWRCRQYIGNVASIFTKQILRKYFLSNNGVNISVCIKNVFKNPNNSSTTKSENIFSEWIVWNGRRNKMNNTKSSYNFDTSK